MASDDFTGADGTHLHDHDGNWASVNSGAIDDYTIYSNSLRLAAWRSFGVYYETSTLDDSTVTHLANNAISNLVRACVRMSATHNGYQVYLYGTSAELAAGAFSAVRLCRSIAGTDSDTFLQTAATGSWATNADHILRITASGTASVYLMAWVDGVACPTTYTDTSANKLTSGNSGLRIYNQNGVSVTAADTWADGTGGGATQIPKTTWDDYMWETV